MNETLQRETVNDLAMALGRVHDPDYGISIEKLAEVLEDSLVAGDLEALIERLTPLK